MAPTQQETNNAENELREYVDRTQQLLENSRPGNSLQEIAENVFSDNEIDQYRLERQASAFTGSLQENFNNAIGSNSNPAVNENPNKPYQAKPQGNGPTTREDFEKGINDAEKILQTMHGGGFLECTATGGMAKGIGYNPIQFYDLTFVKPDGTRVKLGSILPNDPKNHLTGGKTSDEICNEVLKLYANKVSPQSQEAKPQGNGPTTREDFEKGVNDAEKILQALHGGGFLECTATGGMAKGIGYNPIQFYRLTFVKPNGDRIELGSILPNDPKNHLTGGKTSDEICNEVLKMYVKKTSAQS